MKFTKETVETIKFREPKKTGSIKAFATVSLSCGLIVTGVKVINGKQGLFVGMPSQPGTEKDDNGRQKYWNIVYFPDEQDRDGFSKHILEAYYAEFGQQEEQTSGNYVNTSDYAY